MNRRGWIGSTALLLTVLATASGLAVWKIDSIRESNAANSEQPEVMETISIAVARSHEYQRATTSIGTVRSLQSITLRNEMPGAVSRVMLNPGEIVEAGTLLVALDVTVEEAELQAQRAQAALAKTLLDRLEAAHQTRAVSEMEVDRARAEYDVALAQIARIEAIIARKTIVAPFRARVGLSDVHPGQYLEAGTLLTTLQGVDDAVHVDFTVTQQVAAALHPGDEVEIHADGISAGSAHDANAISAEIVAIDARVDPVTRNAMVRARIDDGRRAPAPGSSVRVRTPVGEARPSVAIPATAVRKGPGGDHAFVIVTDDAGNSRAELRRVRSGPMIADEIIIDEGVREGEVVAAFGAFKLRDGALVSVTNAAKASEPDAVAQADR